MGEGGAAEARRDGLARTRIVQLLVSLVDVLPAAAIASLTPHTGHGRAGSRPLRFSETFNAGSYAELLRCLAILRETDRAAYRALSVRYVHCERRVLELPVRRGRWGARIIAPRNVEIASGLAAITGRRARVLVRILPLDVDDAGIERGLAWLVETMHGGDRGRILVPPEMMAEAASG